MTVECLRCGKPMADQAYVDTACTDRVRRALLGDDDRPGLVDTAPAARDIAHGLSNHGGGTGGGKPGSRVPLDLSVTARLDAVQGEVTTWARHVAEERSGAAWIPAGGEPITRAAQYLADNLEWLRHRPEADEAFRDLEAAARIVLGIVRGPAEQKYLGPCGAERAHGHLCIGTVCFEDDFTDECTCWCHKGQADTCEGDVYGRTGAQDGRCRTCGAVVSQDERRAWLDAEVRQHTYTATEISDAYPVKANTIRQWLSRGLLVAHGELGGRPLLNLGEVLDLAAGDAARREEARAQRERRKADRQTEGAAA